MRISRKRRAQAARRQPLARSGTLLALVVAAAVGVTAPIGSSARARPNPAPTSGLTAIEYGKPAPDFTYDAGQGEKKLSDARGRVALVHFWDSWCLPCIDELPLFVRARSEVPKLAVITLSDEQPGVARSYLKEQGIDLPVAEDAEHKIFKLYSVHAIPVSVFVAPDGTVVHVSVGEMDWGEVAAGLAAARARP